MDATVNDFLNEINQISSTNDVKPQLKEESEVWQECYDELTGYSYFWNTESDEVTWVPPKSYKPAENASKKVNAPRPNIDKGKKKTELFVPPSVGTYRSTNVKPEAKSKVYSIQEVIKNPDTKPENKLEVRESPSIPTFSNTAKKVLKRGPFKKNDSDDEKIELISEYGGTSDSDDDNIDKAALNNTKSSNTTVVPIKHIKPLVNPPSGKNIQSVTKKSIPGKQKDSQSENEDDEDDDMDLLAKIQQRAQELKKLGGEVPLSVKKIIQHADIREKVDKPKPTSGFALVAGYNSDSSESEEETPPPKAVFPLVPPPKPIPETSHSTLFPITKPIDVKDFIVPESLPTEVKNPVEEKPTANGDFDNKAFQRKRRIGISLVNNLKRPKEDGDTAGLGYKNDSTTNIDPKVDKTDTLTMYPGFQKGGVMFVKSDVLNPTTEGKQPVNVDEDSSINKKETENDYTVLREKLLFLGEGREPVFPVQVMIIQAETLFFAMKEGGLKLSYLYKWLKETCSELIKLEKEAAPEGWLLQWDRSHKRYFYQNQTTGVSQWRYPEPDVTRCDEAMEICMTPPPQDLPQDAALVRNTKPISPVTFGPQLPMAPPLPPSPPKIRSPTPPPPPIISVELSNASFTPDVPLPPKPQSPEPVILHPLPSFENNQPLPPGVDLLPDAYNRTKSGSDTLGSALDSFYSEIAEVSETPKSSSPTPSSQISEVAAAESLQDLFNHETTDMHKKKKKKVKLVPGLTMKKKGVSQLVEKWKNVQKNYGD